MIRMFAIDHSHARTIVAKGLTTILLLAAIVNLSHAQSAFDEDFDDDTKAWQEIAIQLPAAPVAANLLPFEVSATATQLFAIDAKSLTVGTDGVVRYTMVTTSPEGAKNVSYEGIRCASFERKSYAFGHPDGSWSRSRHDKWERIVRNAANRQHAILFKDYFCNGSAVAGNAQQILDRLRYQRPLTDFLGQ
jgi:hypothetical protein